jgi:CheY-like chemotaxis protein
MALKNCTVLYVEDDIDTQEVLKSILEMQVKELYVASNGKEGLELYKSKIPNIVLSDISMPIMNGITMCEEIKKINPHQDVLMLTAFRGLNEFKAKCNVEYVSKPIIDFHHFLGLLNNMGDKF